jgi:hypothetical protein
VLSIHSLKCQGCEQRAVGPQVFPGMLFSDLTKGRAALNCVNSCQARHHVVSIPTKQHVEICTKTEARSGFGGWGGFSGAGSSASFASAIGGLASPVSAPSSSGGGGGW